MKLNTCVVALGMAAGLIVAGCATAPRTESARSNLHEEVTDTIETMTRVDPDLRPFLSRAYGYAVFPMVGKAGFIFGGAYGSGEVYEQGKFAGWCDITQATVGAQIGAQGYSELIAFEDQRAMNRFKGNQLAFAAQATAVALKSGAATHARYTDGVTVFAHTQGGLMAEAAIGGQQFTFKPNMDVAAANK